MGLAGVKPIALSVDILITASSKLIPRQLTDTTASLSWSIVKPSVLSSQLFKSPNLLPNLDFKYTLLHFLSGAFTSIRDANLPGLISLSGSRSK